MKRVLLAVAVATAAFGGTCSSNPSAPGAVVGQGNCVVDDKLFGTIGYVSGTVPATTTVQYFKQVIGGEPYYTVQFAGNLGSGFSVDYLVTVTDPGWFIDRITADISNPARIGNPMITKIVDESGALVGTLTATASAPSGVLAGHWTQLHITDSYSPNGGAATSFGNTFHQSMNQTPEPATMGMLGLGLIGLVAVARRKSRASK